MAQALYAPGVVVRTLAGPFFERRGLVAAAPPPGDDEIVAAMETLGYVRLRARRREPRGARHHVEVLVLAPGGEAASHLADLRRLLDGAGEHPAALDEVLVVAADDFFARKNLVDHMRERAAAAAAAAPAGLLPADPAGARSFISALPYCVFSCVVPDHAAVPPHRLLSEAEAEAFLSAGRLAAGDLPTLPASDPPIVWLGGREGQLVEILRPSTAAGMAPYVRRITAFVIA